MTDGGIDTLLEDVRARITPHTTEPDVTYGFFVDARHCVELRVRSGSVDVVSVPYIGPSCTLSVQLDSATLRALLAGQTSPQAAFIRGKIRVAGGSIGAASNIGKLLR